MTPSDLPDFSRRQWVSAQARSVWEPRITSIGQHFAAAERASVGEIRSAALQGVSPAQFPELAQRAAKIGLVATPLGLQGQSEGYAASSVKRTASESWEYRVALTTHSAAWRFVEAWQGGDDETIGRLLGYPKCCRDFFSDTWGAGSVDPTWSMANHFDDEGDGPIEANILLRWLGVRYVPHLPCSFRCKDTIGLGRDFRALIPEREREWMDELLSMPMLWSSLNGIGEVVTPIVTLNFRSDVDHELHEIRRQGVSYPEAGAHGLRFPYRLPTDFSRDTIPGGYGHKVPAQSYLWTDNGFSSREAMDAGHEMILSALAGIVSRITTGDTGIVDLGAGNGELLRKLGRGVGVESDAGRAGRRVWPGVRLGRIQDAEELFSGKRFAVAIISARRFEELPEEDNSKLRAWLEQSVGHVLIYQYEQPQFARVVVPHDVPVLEIAR